MATILHEISPVLGALEKNIFEHITLMAQEQLEVEFREEIAQFNANATMECNKMPRTTNATSPQFMQMQQQLLGMQLSMESRKAKLIAEMTQEFMEEEE